MTTCPNEKYIMQALNRQAPEKIPSFCQSLMTGIKGKLFGLIEDDIEEDDILLTDIGDLTLYKKVGYSSHWCGAPKSEIVADDVLLEHVEEKTKKLHEQGDENFHVTKTGAIKGANEHGTWFVEASIHDEEELEFFLDHLTIKSPTVKEKETWRNTREQAFKKDFVPFISSSVVVEPANQMLSFGLTAKLMRKNPELINRVYDFYIKRSELQFKAAIDVGYKCFCTPDDCAFKTGPMFSPKNYRKYVMPRAKILCDMVRDAGGVIFMHTDGFIDPIMDCFIDAGYHAVQPLEPTSGMTVERVKRKWGDQLACIGNVDTTNTLSFGTPKDVRKYVHKCFREAKDPHRSSKNESWNNSEYAEGIEGYIFAASGSLHGKVKVENFLAMMDEYKKIRDREIPI